MLQGFWRFISYVTNYVAYGIHHHLAIRIRNKQRLENVEFQKVYQESFKQSLSEEHLVEGVKQFIIRLANTNVRLAVASSAARPKIELVLTRFGLSRYFYSTVSGYEVKESKPAPDVFIESALKLNTHPSDCIVIEDFKLSKALS